MQTKRDQVQAHMFVMGRLTSGMLRADPDAPESPQGRTNRGTAIGVVIAVLFCAGAFVFGLIKPGTSGSWRAEGTLVVDKNTGSSYLYLADRLRPVRNYASAKLLSEGKTTVATVGTASLQGALTGPPVGIPGAPESLPAAGQLLSSGWQVCTLPPLRRSGPAGTSLSVEAFAGDVASKDGAMLVSAPDGSLHMVWRGARMRIAGGPRVVAALGYGDVAPVPVSASFLSALPAGPDLKSPRIDGRGLAGSELAGASSKVGQLFRAPAPGGGEQTYVLLPAGLSPITDTVARLLAADPLTGRDAYGDSPVTARRIGVAEVATHSAPAAANLVVDRALPAFPPAALQLPPKRLACVTVRTGADGIIRTELVFVDMSAQGLATSPPRENLTPACLPVDRVFVPPGRGVLVHALSAGGTDIGSAVHLVTDTGVKYRVADDAALKALGYEGSEAQPVPSLLLSMLPTGPDMSVANAVQGLGRTTAPRCSQPSSNTHADFVSER
ncbi:type VII secretion protein EccB [Streptomyces zaomyceticus]|uniref:type VII secretion protein EccB n=1 Tax=Streptomyces zaomyceticus TaxID=68286 RepID=UPI0036A49334